jgi:hypothetical protein
MRQNRLSDTLDSWPRLRGHKEQRGSIHALHGLS